jgi:hypothetical protein
MKNTKELNSLKRNSIDTVFKMKINSIYLSEILPPETQPHN